MTSSVTRDFSATPTNAYKFTISFWIKLSHVTTNQMILCNYGNSGNDDFQIQYRNDEGFHLLDYKGGSVQANYETDRVFIDTGAWYHIVFAGDSTQSTAADRMKMYVNGVQEPYTTFNTVTDKGQNTDWNWNKETAGTSLGHIIGKSGSGGNAFSGYLAHIHNVDGQAYAPTKFGETDSTTGEWKPILAPTGVSYGNNGWWLKFESSANLGLDSSGNSSNFTVGGDLKQSQSTPSNTFCTINAWECYQTGKKDVLKYGNTGWADGESTSDGYKGAVGTLGSKNGKWYFEVRHIEGMYTCLGISKANSKAANETQISTQRTPFLDGNLNDGFGFQAGTAARQIQRGDGTVAAWNVANGDNIASVSANDILMCAYDLDAGKIWWGRNGTWNTVPGSDTTVSSSDVVNGNNAHKTWTADDKFWRPAVAVYQRTYGSSGANPNTIQINFGEGRFGTDAVASGNTDSQSVGTFEYAPPTGYLCVCTKNIKDTG